MGWSGGSTTTQSTTQQPWAAAEPLLKTGLGKAQELFDKGTGSAVYSDSTVVPFSDTTKAAMSGLAGLAGRNSGGSGLANSAQTIMNQGGFNAQQLDAMKGLTAAGQRNDDLFNSLGGNGLSSTQNSALSALQGSARDVGALMGSLSPNGLTGTQEQALSGIKGGLSDLGAMKTRFGDNGLTSDQDIALNNYRNTATSGFAYSPDFQAVLDASLDDARSGVNANAAAAGRYGSGTAQGIMADKLGRISNEARLGEYRDWQGRKDAANANLSNLAQTGIGNQTNAIQLGQGLNSSLANLGQQGLNNRTAGIQLGQGIQGDIAALGQQGVNNRASTIQNGQGINSALFNAGQAGLGNLQGAYEAAQLPFQTQMLLGSMDDDLASRQMADKLRIFNEQQSRPWEQLGRLNAVASGAGQMGGTTTASQPGQNPFLSALGYGATGLGLLGGLF